MKRLRGFIAAHRAMVLVAVTVVGIVVVTFVVIRAGTDTASKAATPAPVTTAPRGPAGELVRLVERGRSVNVDVAYTGTTGASRFTTHLWRRSPLARIDSEVNSPDATTRSAQIVTSSGPVACTQQGSAPWSCAPKPGLGVADVGVVSPALVARLSTLEVTVRDDRILGTEARCFSLARPTATTVAGAATADASAAGLCLTSDGIPVRVEGGSTRLEAVSLNRGRPPDSVFKPPA